MRKIKEKTFIDNKKLHTPMRIYRNGLNKYIIYKCDNFYYVCVNNSAYFKLSEKEFCDKIGGNYNG